MLVTRRNRDGAHGGCEGERGRGGGGAHRGDEVRVVVWVLRRRWCGRGGVRATGDEGGGAMASRPGHRSRPGEVNGERPLFLLLLRGESSGAAAAGEERAASRRLTASGRRRGGGAAASGEERRGEGDRGRGREGDRGPGRKNMDGGTILMAHHPPVRHKYIHTNGAPHPSAPLVIFF